MMDPERTPLVADEAGSPSGGSTHAHGVTIGRSPAGGDGLAARFFVATGLAAGPDDVGLVGTLTPAAPDDAGASGV